MALERLSFTHDGRVCTRLKRPWPQPGGLIPLTLNAGDVLNRWACLIPPPRPHLIRSHSVFATGAKERQRLPPPPPRIQWGPTAGDKGGSRPDDLSPWIDMKPKVDKIPVDTHGGSYGIQPDK